ncbi:mannose-6-phosphate isomerase [Agrocybe pediades]|nr:mannose-6-phosphate isomerase [Agrocybe pediades]
MSKGPSVFKIIPTTQQYDWGRTGRSSKVAEFAEASQIPGFKVDESAPYAELWMGTHTKSPSHVRSSNQVLSEYLAKQPELLGGSIVQEFDAGNGNLPFLFKVLSIEKALSIQSHPDKKTAEKLHAEQPDIYKDPNHKPEMALAITPFRALCGFRPLNEIAAYLNRTPEFRAMIPPTIVDEFLSLSDSKTPDGPAEKAALKNLFSSLMTAEEKDIKEQVASLLKRYKAGETHDGEDGDLVKLVLRLDSQFPGDIGVFCAYVLNYIHLNPGQAIFLGAGEPHAYISGECMECMANSDNVIRAGLTPKLRDIPNLVSGLTYTASVPTKHTVKPRAFKPASKASSASALYDPPIPEFSVVQVKLLEGKKEEHPPLGGPSIAIVTEGKGKVSWGDESLDVGLGEVFFIGAASGVTFKNEGEGRLTIYRAYVEADVDK